MLAWKKRNWKVGLILIFIFNFDEKNEKNKVYENIEKFCQKAKFINYSPQIKK